MVTSQPQQQTPLHDDLVAMLTATLAAERDLFGALPPETRGEPRRIGDWSVKDVWAHLSAWRATEAARLANGENASSPSGADMPGAASEDEANARIQAERAGWSWEAVTAAAEHSVDDLASAIRATPAETLRSSDRLVAGIGSNGANHALGHLSDVALLSGSTGQERYRAFAREIEDILLDGRLPDRDSGVMLYNIACHFALSGELGDARRLLTDAFRLRPDLVEFAPTDPDLAGLHGELGKLAGT